MTLEELAEAVYEDLDGQIVSVCSTPSGQTLVFKCASWDLTEGDRVFEIIFDEIAETSATPSPTETIRLYDEHPLLWRHNGEQIDLYFAAAPEQPTEILGRLYAAHSRLIGNWRPFEEHVCGSVELLQGGYGKLAAGPRNLIEAFARVVGPEIRPSIAGGHTPAGGWRLAVFDGCHVVFKTARVEAR